MTRCCCIYGKWLPFLFEACYSKIELPEHYIICKLRSHYCFGALVIASTAYQKPALSLAQTYDAHFNAL